MYCIYALHYRGCSIKRTISSSTEIATAAAAAAAAAVYHRAEGRYAACFYLRSCPDQAEIKYYSKPLLFWYRDHNDLALATTEYTLTLPLDVESDLPRNA